MIGSGITAPPPDVILGYLGPFEIRDNILYGQGWALKNKRTAIDAFDVYCNGALVPNARFERGFRQRVVNNFPDADRMCGFHLQFDLADIAPETKSLALQIWVRDEAFLLAEITVPVE